MDFLAALVLQFIIISMDGPKICSYLIFVTNAANAVRVNFLAECKKNSRKKRKLLFWAPFISQH